MRIIDERQVRTTAFLHEDDLNSLAREAEILAQDIGLASVALAAKGHDYAAALANPGQETIVKVVCVKGARENAPSAETIAVRVLGEWAGPYAKRGVLGHPELAIAWHTRGSRGGAA